MTLGIATIENNEVFIMADTLLSFPEKSGKKPFHGLKVFFLNKEIAIAYAGIAEEVAHGRLNAIYTQGHKGDIHFLSEQICQSFDDKVDFLLAQSGARPAIAKITEGSVSIREDDGVYWIGDIDAARYVARAASSSANQLQQNLGNVIENPQFSTVGGHCVVARGRIEGFKFVPYMRLISPSHFPRKCDWEIVDFGSAQTGGFGYTTVVPINEGVNGWGVFYFQGMYGEFWHVNLESNMSELLRAYARKVQDFTKIIEDETGIELEYCGSLGDE